MESVEGCKICGGWELKGKFRVNRAIARLAGGLTLDAR
jgi:hypothetical protein